MKRITFKVKEYKMRISDGLYLNVCKVVSVEVVKCEVRIQMDGGSKRTVTLDNNEQCNVMADNINKEMDSIQIINKQLKIILTSATQLISGFQLINKFTNNNTNENTKEK